MKYFIVPPPEAIEDAQPDKKTGKQPLLSFDNLCDEQVWGDEAWRKDGASEDELIALKPRIKGKPPGTVVECSTRGYEIFLPLVTMEGKKVPPGMAVEIAKLCRPVRRATEKPPEAPKAAEAAAEKMLEASNELGAADTDKAPQAQAAE